MSHRIIARLRRCRALFALALCAWLGLVGMAWAGQDCCASMGGAPALHQHAPEHADDGHHHHHAAEHADCVCAHAPATVPAFVGAALLGDIGGSAWRALPSMAPLPDRPPPLRPPLS